jgi:hypothetical protein
MSSYRKPPFKKWKKQGSRRKPPFKKWKRFQKKTTI